MLLAEGTEHAKVDRDSLAARIGELEIAAETPDGELGFLSWVMH